MSDQIIKRYKKQGTIADDKYFVQTQETYRTLIESEMRDEGFVPLYDINPVFRTWVVDQEAYYHFSYTMQGVYVGEERAWHIKGVVNNRPVEKSTPTSPTK